jgi:hypothetical protein
MVAVAVVVGVAHGAVAFGEGAVSIPLSVVALDLLKQFLLARFLLGRLAVGGGLYLPFLGRAAIPSACFSVSGEGGMKARR